MKNYINHLRFKEKNLKLEIYMENYVYNQKK